MASRGRKPFVVVALALTFLLLPISGSPAAAPRPRKIVLVSMPHVDWSDVAAGDAPNLGRLAEEWSIAALSVRTVGPKTDLASALITIGAGNRARAHGAQPIFEGDAEAAPNAVVGPGGASVRGMQHIQADNADLHFGASPGALGQRLKLAGLTTGVAGNADGGYVRPTSKVRKGVGLERRRFGALALADRSGRVDFAIIGDELNLADPDSLNGFRANPLALAAAARQVISESDVSLIELTDTYRESQVAFVSLRHVGTPGEPNRHVQAAVRRDDALLGELIPMVDLSRDSLVVLGTSGPGLGRSERLELALMAGVGATRSGWLTSATTLRDGLVTVSDVGPGVLKLLGLSVPEQMSGQPFRSIAGPEGGRLDRIVRLQEEALFHMEWVGRFFLIFVGLQLVLYLIALWSLRPGGIDSPWLRRLTLGFMSVPASTLFLAALDPNRLGPAGPLVFVVVVSSVLTAVALRGPWRGYPAGPPTFICAINLLVILADLASGANLQLSSLIGYSPIVAGRFYGVGNLSFAVLATSALLVAGQVGARFGRAGIWMAAGIGIVTIVADGALGADFGGMLSLIPAFGVLLAQLFGRRVSAWRLLVLCGVAAVIALIVGVLDSMRPPEVQTHVGRFAERLIGAGPEAVREVIIRKARANWAILTQSSLTLSVPVALGFLALLLTRPEGKLRSALDTQPGLRTGLIAAIVANALGFALNDSGVAVPAMGLAIMAPFCLATIHGMPDAVKS
jgi:hypothetical protein